MLCIQFIYEAHFPVIEVLLICPRYEYLWFMNFLESINQFVSYYFALSLNIFPIILRPWFCRPLQKYFTKKYFITLPKDVAKERRGLVEIMCFRTFQNTIELFSPNTYNLHFYLTWWELRIVQKIEKSGILNIGQASKGRNIACIYHAGGIFKGKIRERSKIYCAESVLDICTISHNLWFKTGSVLPIWVMWNVNL